MTATAREYRETAERQAAPYLAARVDELEAERAELVQFLHALRAHGRRGPEHGEGEWVYRRAEADVSLRLLIGLGEIRLGELETEARR